MLCIPLALAQHSNESEILVPGEFTKGGISRLLFSQSLLVFHLT